MCDPVTATAMALSAGGSYLEGRETKKNAKRAVNARNDVYQDYVNKQSDYANEAAGSLGQMTEKESRAGFDETAQQGKEKMTQAFGNIQNKPDYSVGMVSSAPKNVVLAREASGKEASDKTSRDLNALSTLRGYGEGTFQKGLNQNEFARAFGNVQSKAGGDTKLLPLEMRSAEINSQKGPSLFPTLLKVAGAGMGMYGAGGGSLFGPQNITAPASSSTGSMINMNTPAFDYSGGYY